jgi:hypothetical protein
MLDGSYTRAPATVSMSSSDRQVDKFAFVYNLRNAIPPVGTTLPVFEWGGYWWADWGAAPVVGDSYTFGVWTAARDYSDDSFSSPSSPPGITPGNAAPYWILLPNTFSTTAVRWYSVAHFPILANPGDTITSATFSVSVANQNLFIPSDAQLRSISFRTTYALPTDVNLLSLSNWPAVLSWPLTSATAFTAGPIPALDEDTWSWDVTSIVQAIISSGGFTRGYRFAAIIEEDEFSPQNFIQVTSQDYRGIGDAFADGEPQPSPDSLQAELVIT